MKYLCISAAVLSLLLVLSLLNARAVGEETGDWCLRVEEARAAAGSGDTEAAAARMDELRSMWLSRRTYYHIVLEHDELDNVEELLERSLAALECGDAEGFYEESAALTVQLRVLAEMQGLSIENVL